MEWKIRANDRQTAIYLAAMTLVGLSGCATRSPSLRTPVAAIPAPDRLDVSAVAPSINAGPTGLAGATCRPPDSSIASRTRFASSNDQAVSTASISTSIVTQAVPESPKSQDPNRLSTPEIDFNAGLMGPTPPVTAEAASTPATIPQSTSPYPIDLATALRLADAQNPAIGEARVMILGALAERQAARALLLPSLNVGTNYRDHNGPLQRSNGSILSLHSQSLYFGGGAGAFGANTVTIPAVSVFSPLTDAIFAPLAAQQRVVSSRWNASDTANKVLLEVASLYIDLIGAEAILEVRREIAGESDRIAASVEAYATTGQGRKSDADRADADRRLFQAEIQVAEERVAVASARLAERLNLNPSAELRPIAGPLEPLELINPEIPPEELIRAALARRPDLAAREALVSQAEYRVKQEQGRPLLPTVWLGFSGGAFGGGSNLTATPMSAFAGRTDFDIRVYWTLLNFGAGNASLIKQRKTQTGQAVADRARVINQIRREVAAARAESLALRSQVTMARFGLQTAEDGYRQDQTRLRETLALPIEALDSLRLLSDARVSLVEAITRANRTQFSLFVSLGSPPPLDTPPVGTTLPPRPTVGP